MFSNLEKLGSQLMIVLLFFLFGGGIILFTGQVESSSVAKIMWATIYLITIALVFSSSRMVVLSVQRNSGFFTLAVLSLISTFWSSDRATTLSYSFALMGATLAAYLLATKVEPMRLLRLVTIGVLIIISINFIFMLPGLNGNLSAESRYAGIFPQPNVLGRITGLGVLLLVCLYCSGGMSRWAYVGIAMGLSLILASNSMTTVVAVVISLSIFFIRKSMVRPIASGYALIALWFTLCIGGLIWLSHDAVVAFVFEIIGRSTNLTGRTGLWDGISSAIYQKPLLGYGYSGFWEGEPILSDRVMKSAGWTTKSAHNGILDVALHLGGCGVVIFIATVLRIVVNSMKLAFGTSLPLASILFSIMCYLLILGATESTYMMRNSIYWVLLVICAVYTEELKRVANCVIEKT